MTTKAIKIKGEQVSFMSNDDVEKLLTGTATGNTPTGWNFKVKGTALYWVDDDGAERSNVGALTGNTGTAGIIKVKGNYTRYIDDDGNERQSGQRVTLTVNPDAHPETTSVDGQVFEVGQLTWADLIAADGDGAFPSQSGSFGLVSWRSDVSVTDKWDFLYRSILLSDTNSIPAIATIISATLSIYGTNKQNDGSIANIKVNIYSSNPATNIDLIGADYTTLGSTPFCDTDITYEAWDTAGYNEFILNADGLAAIAKAGITKLGMREVTYDIGSVSPTWGANETMLMAGNFADAGSNPPKLVVTYE